MFLYILKNKSNKYYTGITKFKLEERLNKHNKGEVHSTKHNRPWSLLYSEVYESYKDARAREKQIKSWHGGNAFKKLISSVAGSSLSIYRN